MASSVSVPPATFASNNPFFSTTALALASAANALMASLSFLRRDANVISPSLSGGIEFEQLGQDRLG